MKEIIRERLIRAREEKGFTQKDLASRLRKTSAAISEVERGKNNISADDLYSISWILDKPIEYFYGEDYLNKDVEEIIALIKKLPKDVRNLQLPIIRSLLRLAEKKNEYDTRIPSSDDEIVSYAKEFLGYLIVYIKSLDDLRKQALSIKKQFDISLGINLSGEDKE